MSDKKKVLILGAGLVTKPIVTYLLDQGYLVTVASRTVSKAEDLISGHENGNALSFNINDAAALDKLVSSHDLTVSLLPANFHVIVAKSCIKNKKLMVTTSYVSDEMRSLDEEAKKAGIIILNELGLDPGIDHMSAMKIIDDVNSKGGKITQFCSYCGGLPAPEANDNPWGYKFSWAPRGVLVAATNNARYKWKGELREVDSKDLFKHKGIVEVGGMKLESYPNRDSMGYVPLYGLESAETMFRATLRNLSHCDAWLKIVQCGLLDLSYEIDVSGKTRREFFAELTGLDKENLEEELMKKFNIKRDDPFMQRMDFIEMFSEIPVGIEKNTPLDILSHMVNEKLVYKPGERDMCVLFHDFIAEFPDRKENITSTLIDYGIPDGDSSMARLVSIPPAVGVKLILEGKINLTGVHIPVLKEIYEPVLAELETMDIRCIEEVKPL